MEGYLDKNIEIKYDDIIKDKVININFFGCNFNCISCKNKEFKEFKTDSLVEIKELKKEIERIAMNSKYIFFEGGEPTLQRVILTNLLKFSKGLELETIIKTNGSKPNVIKEIIDKDLLDIIIVDIKSSLDKKKFEEITKASNFFISCDKIIKQLKKTLEILKENEEKIKIIATTHINNKNIYEIEDIYDMVASISNRWVIIFNKNRTDTLIKRFIRESVTNKNINTNIKEENGYNVCYEDYVNIFKAYLDKINKKKVDISIILI